jgi:hypothetical protein
MNNYGSRTYDTTNALGHPARDGNTPQFQRYATQAQEAPADDSMSRLQGIASDVVNDQRGAAESEHIVGVMIQDESGSSIQRRIKVGGSSEQEAVARARTHYTNHGQRVLDAWYMSPYGGSPAQSSPAQNAPTQNAPMQSAPAQPAPMRSAPAQNAPTQSAPVQNAPVREISTKIRNRYARHVSGSAGRTGREETREMFADQQEEFTQFRVYVQLENKSGEVISRTFKTRASDEDEATDNAESFYSERGYTLLGAEVEEA